MTLEQATHILRELALQVPAVGGRVRLDGTDLIIDHPQARGALTVEMMVELAEAVAELPARSLVVLRGSRPGSFCSGGHLGQVRQALGEPERGRAMAEAMGTVLDALWAHTGLVVAVVDGFALGGGAELLTACDLVLATPESRLGFVQARWGVSTGWGGGRRLVARLGRQPALRILALHQVYTAEQARALGLVDVVTETPEQVVERLQSAGPPVLAALKRMVGDTSQEAEVFAGLWGGPEHLGRLAAAQQGQDQG